MARTFAVLPTRPPAAAERSAACSVLLALALAGCGGGGSDGSPDDGDPAPETGAALAAGEAASPEVADPLDAVEQAVGPVEAEPDGVGTVPPGTSAPDVSATAADLIGGHPRLGELSRAIGSSSLGELFADPDQRMTIIAPSDAAFEAYSAAQRGRVLDDPDAVRELLEHHIVLDTKLTGAAVELVDRAYPVAGAEFGIDRVDGTITLDDGRNPPVSVAETLLNDDVVVHVVDEFFGLRANLFTSDEGSIAARLDEIGSIGLFANRLRDSNWFGPLGNAERHWSVLAPENDALSPVPGTDPDSFDAFGRNVATALADHIVEHDAEQGVAVAAGDYRAASGGLVTIAEGPAGYAANGRDIAIAGALAAVNGHVHVLRTPMGVDASIPDLVGALDAMAGPDPYGYYGYGRPARLMSRLVREFGDEAAYADPSRRLTIVMPESDYYYGGIGSTCDGADSYVSAIRRFGDLQDSGGGTLVPSVFPDARAAAKYLRDHTLDGAFSSDGLRLAAGGEVRNLSGDAFAVSERDDGDGHYVAGPESDHDFDVWDFEEDLIGAGRFVPRSTVLLDDAVATHVASVSNGSVLQASRELVRVERPEAPSVRCDLYGNPLPPVAVAMQDAGLGGFVDAVTVSFGTYLLEEVDWTVLAPTDIALEAEGIEIDANDYRASDAIVSGGLVFGAFGPDALVEGGSVETIYGDTYLVERDANGDLVVGGAVARPVSVDGGGAAVYALDGVPTDASAGQDIGDSPGNEASDAGPTLDAIRAAGLTEFARAFEGAGFGFALDDNAWTLFVPTNDALAASTYSGEGVQLVQDHVLVEGAFGSDELSGGSPWTTHSGIDLDVVETDGTILVNGLSATRVEVPGPSAVYAIGGVLR